MHYHKKRKPSSEFTHQKYRDRWRILLLPFIMTGIVVSCEGNPTDTTPPLNGNGFDDPKNLYFTQSDYRGGLQEVTQYAESDSLFVVAIEEKNYRPPYSPIWLYSHYARDKEVILMDTNRPLPNQFPENYIVGTSLLPDTTRFARTPFDGVLAVWAGGDSITAIYFSQTYNRLISTGAIIGSGDNSGRK